jgi:hypothetical protein
MRCVRCGWPSKNYEMSNDGRPVRAPRRRLPARSARCRRAPRLRGAPGHLPTVPGGPWPRSPRSRRCWPDWTSPSSPHRPRWPRRQSLTPCCPACSQSATASTSISERRNARGNAQAGQSCSSALGLASRQSPVARIRTEALLASSLLTIPLAQQSTLTASRLLRWTRSEHPSLLLVDDRNLLWRNAFGGRGRLRLRFRRSPPRPVPPVIRTSGRPPLAATSLRHTHG